MKFQCKPNTPECRTKVENALIKLAELRKRPIICIYHDQSRNETIDYNSVKFIRDISPQFCESKKVSLLLDSPGGDIEDAYRMLSALRQHVDDIEVLVPFWAKSAATFFCLGANQILMGCDGELGPLDPQLLHPGGSKKPVSPLETFQALEHLRTYTVETIDAMVALFIRRTKMDVPNAIDKAHPYVSATISPLYSQLDPHEMGELGRHLRVSEEYATRAMKRWGYPAMSRDNISKIVRRLVWDYPTHGFVIDLKEAQEIGLNAVSLDKDADKACKDILDVVSGCTGVWIPQEKPAQSEKVEEEKNANVHSSKNTKGKGKS